MIQRFLARFFGRDTVSRPAQAGFVVTFPTIDANDCHGFAMPAIGSDGSRATLARKAGECPPPTSVGQC